jgi:multiple sugar transport system permease protein
VGLDNFARALQDDKLLSGVLRMAQFFFIQVPVMLGIALFAALAIDSGLLRFARAFRIGIFIPFAVPGVVAVLMWGYLYGDFGPFTQLARQFELPIPEFLSPDLALASLANVVTWEYTGYNMIILFTALQAIDRTLYEAAAVDGASSPRIAWSIKIPLLRPAIMLTVLFSVIGSFQLFTEAELLQRIAPTVIDSSYTPNLYTYTLSFIGQQVNYAAAVSFLLGIVIVLVSYVVLIVANRTGRR